MGESRLIHIDIEGYRSIRKCSLDLGDINILIGSNGAGKSNFISVFSLIQKILTKELQLTVSRCGIQSMLFNGRKVTGSLSIDTHFGNNSYGFTLEPTDDERMMFTREYFGFRDKQFLIDEGHFESKWEDGVNNGIDDFIKPLFAASAWRVYHFHDTSRTSAMKSPRNVHDSLSLHQDAGNIAAFLLRLKEEYPSSFASISAAVKRVNPLFGGFVLQPNEATEEILLRWTKSGTDVVMGPNQLSDGTIRFICLCTLLLQPHNLMPPTIILDEPELGLFPQAMVYLAEMIRAAGVERQIIISTQSVDLVDQFRPDEVIIVSDDGDGTGFKRPDAEYLQAWLDNDYTLGTLWKKNLLQGDR